jgi:hypothetical protein
MSKIKLKIVWTIGDIPLLKVGANVLEANTPLNITLLLIAEAN